MTIDKPGTTAENGPHPAILSVRSFLDNDEIRYHILEDNAVEMYMQAKNLTIQLIIYVHNNHLIFRVPGYIRNVDLNRLEILTFIMRVMNEILDIRFEVPPDGKSLSACCHHILEDGTVTRAQFDLAMMVILHIVDDTYPQFMQIIYSENSEKSDFAPMQKPDESPSQSIESEDDLDTSEENEDVPLLAGKKGLKIN